MAGHLTDPPVPPGDSRDPLSPAERSERMSHVRSRGNKSTELAVKAALGRRGITGWRRHANLPGTPDFYFPKERLAIFVHGCFWHGCPRCGRRPKSRVEFWSAKIDANCRRDARTRRALRSRGMATMTVWEHEIRHDRWIGRLEARLGALRARAGSIRGSHGGAS